MKKLLGLLVLGIFVQIASAQDFDCIKLKDEETTRQGYSATIVFKEKKPFKTLRGKVVLGFQAEPQQDAYVEIFEDRRGAEKYKRVAGCRTTASGLFHFPDLPKGNYKMILSKDGGFQITKVHFKISPKSKRKDELSAVLEVGH
jgi:hypothetical protein